MYAQGSEERNSTLDVKKLPELTGSTLGLTVGDSFRRVEAGVKLKKFVAHIASHGCCFSMQVASTG